MYLSRTTKSILYTTLAYLLVFATCFVSMPKSNNTTPSHAVACLYYALWSLFAMFNFFVDKICSKLQTKKRIPEYCLLYVTVMGGIVGTLIGMLLFVHKTTKCIFWSTIGVAAVIHGPVMYMWCWPVIEQQMVQKF